MSCTNQIVDIETLVKSNILIDNKHVSNHITPKDDIMKLFVSEFCCCSLFFLIFIVAILLYSYCC
jgi:hypothetical protein